MTGVAAAPVARRRPPVALLDESYRYTPSRPVEASADDFYVLAAVILDGHTLEEARSAALDVVETGTNFHATDLWHQGDVATLHRMLEHVRDEAGWNVVAIESPYAGHADRARQACLRRLLIELNARGVRHVCADSRYQPKAKDPEKHDKADLRTLRELRSARLVDRQMTMRHAADADEPLLWLPDGVAWAVRRALAVEDNEHFEIVRDVTSLIVLE